MVSSVLSVLLMGMVPLATPASADQVALNALAISSPLPAAVVSSVSALPRRVTASGMIILDLQSGQTVYAREAEKHRSIGSLTKLMTALIIAENHALDEIVAVPDDIGEIEGSLAHLPKGQHFTVGDLLSALLVPSGNDAAQTLAVFHSGSVESFVTEMNERAAVLGLKDTNFANPDGLDDPKQWSTPRDIAWLATFVMRRPELRQRMSMPSVNIKSQEGTALNLENTHELIRQQSAVVAGKTGTTSGAGQCLVSLVKEGGREYVVVLLRSRGRYTDMRAVLGALADLFA